MNDPRDAVIAAAVKSGGLVRWTVKLEMGEHNLRRLWVRPEIKALIGSQQLHPSQRAAVEAASKRFVTGGPFSVVTAQSQHKEVEKLGDLKELKTDPPPFVEMRFKPPKDDLRFFGRFIGKDDLVLTGCGLKSIKGSTGKRPLKVSDHLARCTTIFGLIGFDINWVPRRIQDSLSNANFG